MMAFNMAAAEPVYYSTAERRPYETLAALQREADRRDAEDLARLTLAEEREMAARDVDMFGTCTVPPSPRVVQSPLETAVWAIGGVSLAAFLLVSAVLAVIR